MIKVGSKVRDSITGFKGIAIARTEWLHGCVRITIEPDKLHDSKPIDACTFDEQRVELIEEKAPPMSKQSSARTGGPQRDPGRARMPRR